MLSRQLNVTFGLVIGVLTWGSPALAGDELRPPLGDEWMTSDAPCFVPRRASGGEVVVLGDVWFELPRSDENVGVVKAPQRTTTGMASEGRW
jgi:hypothetical protein